jgi:hypothetical protein
MTWANRVQKIAVGDTVRMKTSFLQSTGQLTGDTPRTRGVVTEILSPDKPYARAVIDWDTPDMPERVVLSNLIRVKARGVADG